MIEWHLETRKLADLKEHPRNPRQLSKKDHDQLAISLDKFGLIDKPAVNLDGQIIAGHQRIKILLAKGVKEAECNIPDRKLSDEEVDEILIRTNKNTGNWDYDILANEWEAPFLVEVGFDAKDFGVDVDLDEEGSGNPDKKVIILECPECKAHFEKGHAKVVDEGC